MLSRRSPEAAQLRAPPMHAPTFSMSPVPEPPRPMRKSDYRSLFDREPLPLQPTQFQFRGKCIHGQANSADNGMHFNVLRVRLRLSVADKAMRKLLALSKPLHQWASPRWPKWTLPSTVILKTGRPRDLPDHLEIEKEVYPRLKPIQGTVIPVYFGLAQYDGKEALVLSDVGGYPLYSSKIPSFTKEEFAQKARPAMQALLSCGYLQPNALLADHHLVDGNIVVLDHERTGRIKWDDFVYDDEHEKEHDSIIEEELDDMWHELQRIQQLQRDAGLRT